MKHSDQTMQATGSSGGTSEDKDKLLADTIEAEITRKPPSPCSIYRVPVKFRKKSDKDTYEPRIVSIGPYHHDSEKFKTTEEHKKWYLHDLISRNTTPNTSLQDFVKEIRKMESHVRVCYAEPIDLDSDKFVKMMVFDGCFILELLYKYLEKRGDHGKHDRDVNLDGADEGEALGTMTTDLNDPILGTTWMIYSVRKDLVLLENQLPFMVLEKLFDLTKYPTRGSYTLTALVTSFFNPILPTVRPVETNSSTKGRHILDLLRNLLLPKQQVMEFGRSPYWEYTQSATDLSETGVKFKKKVDTDCLLDITFDENGVFEIPPFVFGESWTVLLPNLIALEQCRRDYTDQITSYVILMDSLINNENDVKILRKKGIIDGLFNEDEKVAIDINNLFKGAVVDKYYYDGLCNRVNAYCKTRWHRWRATLVRDYFNTPWALISFLAALVLLLLTTAQTVFAILSYSPDKSSGNSTGNP
ncbi:hypothetical protein ACHQM5_010640 [Ranunculus cassubicifolius]